MTQSELNWQLKEALQNIVGNTAEIDAFVKSLSVTQVAKSDFLIKAGDRCPNIYFVNEGIFRTFLEVEDREMNTEFFFENSFAGAFTSFLLETPTSLNIQALEPAMVTVIPKTLLEGYCKTNPCWYALGKHIFEQEFIKKCRRESEFLQLSARERYLNLIDQYPQVEDRIAGYHIASFLGIQAESLSRIRSGKLA
ncbi:Crp/Fnr family transcriptional regulator [Fulvivirga ulvae]|uniref:Crp/Fnr family transcriptional regulator n=1 Tax=Fulvivirga ulvae TaxID=2904245 RepID=UPI001F297C66|nr:Crp/Fnr family transcriptional regulator [Fulvivirga ulvae]UII34679.1 Crp/Fnr family transcriptional regulator [Fulvivirga ulvae]